MLFEDLGWFGHLRAIFRRGSGIESQTVFVLVEDTPSRGRLEALSQLLFRLSMVLDEVLLLKLTMTWSHVHV